MFDDKLQLLNKQTGDSVWNKPELFILSHMFTEAGSGKKKIRTKEQNKKVGS